MNLYLNDMIYAVSQALDAVEYEFAGAVVHHSHRVAFISVSLLTAMKGTTDPMPLLSLAAAASMHDSGLTTYYRSYPSRLLDVNTISQTPYFKQHCIEGEENLKAVPFCDGARDAVLYHHETADGYGPFGLRAEETPLYARLIHLADVLDVTFSLGEVSMEKCDRVRSFAAQNTGSLFDRETAEAFLDIFDLDHFQMLGNGCVLGELNRSLPQKQTDMSFETLIRIADVVAKITDYKSTFTSNHSRGIAAKAERMAQSYGYSSDLCSLVYIAGAFHDIGKLYVPTEILEKPGRLTEEEFDKMKYHALATSEVLGNIRGFEQIRHWAGNHHEKLDGTGYPYGLTGDRLDFIDRLIGCVDIYQALTEFRPYRNSNGHAEAISILRGMAGNNKIDSGIVEDLNKVLCGGDI